MEGREEEQARRAVKDARYEEAYRICAAVHSEGRATPGILFLGAASLLGLRHIHEAQAWMSDLAAAGSYQIQRLYLDAFFQLHARRVDQALLLWTRIIHLYPSDTFADSLIERARHDEERLLADIERPGALMRFVPLEEDRPPASAFKFPRILFRPKKRLLMVLAVVVCSAVIATALWKFADKSNPFSGLAETLPEPPSTGSVIPKDKYKDARFYYKTKEEVVREYKDARALIVKGQVNQGRVMLSKIELSNASFEIKERAKLLREAVPLVPRRYFSDSITIHQVLAEEELYQGAQILWRGTAGPAVTAGDKSQYFVREASAPKVRILVRCECSAPKEGETVEIFGQIDRIRADRSEIVVNSVD